MENLGNYATKLTSYSNAFSWSQMLALMFWLNRNIVLDNVTTKEKESKKEELKGGWLFVSYFWLCITYFVCLPVSFFLLCFMLLITMSYVSLCLITVYEDTINYATSLILQVGACAYKTISNLWQCIWKVAEFCIVCISKASREMA